jgi:hypothetical protein
MQRMTALLTPCRNTFSAGRLVLRIILLSFITALAAGCAGTRITRVVSNADPAYAKSVGRLFVLAQLPDSGWEPPAMFSFSNSHEGYQENAALFKTTLEIRFRNIGVGCSCAVKTNVELDDNVYVNKMKSFNPDALLIVDCTSAGTKNNVMSTANFNLSLIDAATGKRFWRAQFLMNISLTFGRKPSGASMADTMFDTLVSQLKQDNMEVFAAVEPL